MEVDEIPKQEILNIMVNGIISEIFEGMNRNACYSLAWSEFIEFMDKAII